jgi:hypothetical protein
LGEIVKYVEKGIDKNNRETSMTVQGVSRDGEYFIG